MVRHRRGDVHGLERTAVWPADFVVLVCWRAMKSFLCVAAACAALGVTVQLVPPAPPVRPELFGADVISTPDYELNAAFLPDARTVFFTKSTADMSFWTIVSSRLVGDRWTEPEIAPFSGEHSDADLSVAPDGSRLVFISRRPVPGAPGPAVPHIWFVDRTASGWSEPRNATSLNSNAGEYYPSVAADGTVYFESARPGGKGRADVYRARLANGQYSEPEPLGEPLNSPFNEGDAVVAADQSFMILTITGRPDDAGRGDLYISEQRDGRWSEPKRLADGINSLATEFCPSFSPDGRVFYFTSTRGPAGAPPTRPKSYSDLVGRLRGIQNGLGNVYWVPAAAVLGK
jgi:Tol biopolymer transport system component